MVPIPLTHLLFLVIINPVWKCEAGSGWRGGKEKKKPQKVL